MKRIEPQNAPIGQFVNIVLYGENFTNLGGIKCQVGNIAVNAKFLSTSRISCALPPEDEKGIVRVIITLNGHAYSRESLLFHFLDV